ncbi:MAG: hypothetical protein MUE95_10285 [Cyclobacteriaceae bacterium]|jgi:uncharacterized membrane protein YjgN (DUF898 family)|nr:hypothetical protein [Cyclobacteriaceae bacterium]
MPYLRFFFLMMTITAINFMLVGLYKPWLMLWWEDFQNRRKVIRVYGSVALVSLMLYVVVRLID